MAGSLSVATLVANTPVLVQWKDETIEHFLGRMTHLNLVAKNISTLRGIAAAPKLKVIYAFNNRITELPPDLLKLGYAHTCATSCLAWLHRRQIAPLLLGFLQRCTNPDAG